MAAEKDDTNDQKDEDARMYAALGFAFILLVVGIPLWWKTTKVHRVALPYGRIGELGDVSLIHEFEVDVVTTNEFRAKKLAEDLQESFKSSKILRPKFIGRSAQASEMAALGAIHKLRDLEETADLPHPLNPGSLLLLEVPGLARFTESSVVLGNRRTVYFAGDVSHVKLVAVLQDWVLQENSIKLTIDAMEAPTKVGRDAWGRRRIAPSPSYDLLLSLVIPKPESIHVVWDIQKAVSDYLNLFLNHLSRLAEVNVKSQVLYFVNLGVRPKLVETGGPMGFGKHYFIYEDFLPHIITPLEKKIASQVARNPTLNLVLYVPPCEDAPLYIYSKRTAAPIPNNAFISPQWGGIQITDPSPFCIKTEKESAENEATVDSGSKVNISMPLLKNTVAVPIDSVRVMGIFIAQLRLLVGIPDLDPLPKTEVLPLSGPSPREWEMDLLARVRTIEQITSAKLTLQSLSQLLAEIGNIVIQNDVGASVWEATEGVERATKLLAAGDLLAAFAVSRDAFVSAEKAFTDQSLLALLYFPDDQKYAVYIPLFLPVMIPVVFSIKNIVLWFSKKLKGSSKIKEE
ncbi:GPI transamidase component PIG-S [Ischnura elegans]|uniref:GPI transamidase component PIG-S n=1 Tax=Ischnura elegans TaxID=197161 RepID=UPI001ED87B19|nr:GPI transamidase component PIG-S [Ischnura elegans]